LSKDNDERREIVQRIRRIQPSLRGGSRMATICPTLSRLGLLALAVAVAFVLCEIIARITLPVPPYPYRKPFLAFVGDRELTYFHMPNQAGWIDDGLATINGLGLRGPAPAIPKPESIFRILVVGDSIVFGCGVNDDDTFCSILQKSLNRTSRNVTYEVINGGVNGFTTNQERILFERLAPKLQPDLVLVTFYWNDLLREGPKIANQATNASLADGATGKIIPRDHLHMVGEGHWWDHVLRRSLAVYTAGRGIKRLCNVGASKDQFRLLETDLLNGSQSREIDARWAEFSSELERISSFAKAIDCRVGLVLAASREQVRGEYPSAKLQSKAREIAERLDIFVVDPLPRLRQERDKLDLLFIPYDRDHPGPIGHRIIGETIAQELIDTGVPLSIGHKKSSTPGMVAK
jgi:hypothetical protein